MSRVFPGSGNSDYLSNAAAVVSTLPITMAAWAYSTSLTADQVILCIGQSGSTSNNHYHAIALGGATTGDPAQAITRQTDPGIGASTVAYQADKWEHVAGVFVANNNRYVLLNGGNKGSHTFNRTPSGINQTLIGRNTGIQSGGDYKPFAGRIAHAAIWNVALTDQEILALAGGVPPFLIRPNALVAYWPLWGHHSPETDLRGLYPMTVNGTVTQDDSPPTMSPTRWRRRGMIFVPAAGGGGGDTPVSFAATIPMQSLAAVVDHVAPDFPASFAATLPLQTLAASVSHAVPDFPATFAGTVPLQTLAATVTRTVPDFAATFSATIPVQSLAAALDHVVPDHPASFAATIPLQSLAAVVGVFPPGHNVSFGASLPLQQLAAVLTRTVPTFSATFAATVPLQELDAALARTIPDFPATFAATLPLQALDATLVHSAPGVNDRFVSFVAVVPMALLAAVVEAQAPQPSFIATPGARLLTSTPGARSFTATPPRRQ